MQVAKTPTYPIMCLVSLFVAPCDHNLRTLQRYVRDGQTHRLASCMLAWCGGCTPVVRCSRCDIAVGRWRRRVVAVTPATQRDSWTSLHHDVPATAPTTTTPTRCLTTEACLYDNEMTSTLDQSTTDVSTTTTYASLQVSLYTVKNIGISTDILGASLPYFNGTGSVKIWKTRPQYIRGYADIFSQCTCCHTVIYEYDMAP